MEQDLKGSLSSGNCVLKNPSSDKSADCEFTDISRLAKEEKVIGG